MCSPRQIFLGVLLVLFAANAAVAGEPAPAIVGHEWSPGIFAQAKREDKFILLDLEAVWCHWCHVMEATTYRDPEVVRLMGSRYLAVRVDQDARPDLANRYEDYGWPATVIYASDGAELVKRQGYIVEWWDRRNGPAPRGEDIYPELDGAAAFLCANGACASPITSVAALRTRLAKVK